MELLQKALSKVYSVIYLDLIADEVSLKVLRDCRPDSWHPGRELGSGRVETEEERQPTGFAIVQVHVSSQDSHLSHNNQRVVQSCCTMKLHCVSISGWGGRRGEKVANKQS